MMGVHELTAIPSDAIVLSAPLSDRATVAHYEGFRQELLRFYPSLCDRVDPNDRFIIAADVATRQALLNAGNSTAHLLESGLPDIWCRDVCPVITPYHAVQFKYRPPLVEESDAKHIESGYRQFVKRVGLCVTTSDLTVDGGNFCHNGVDSAVITRRMACANNIKREDLIKELVRLTGMKHIAVIPEEPGDKLGHADGVVSWLGPECLVMNRYDEPYQQPFRKEVQTILRQTFPGITIVDLPYAPTEKTWKGYPDATGVYTNILHTANAAYVPVFGLPQDEEAVAMVAQHCDRKAIPVPMGKVAEMGGGLRCLTWQNRVTHRAVPL
ncbi:MAG: agmatine deiminase family protein [bacterium]